MPTIRHITFLEYPTAEIATYTGETPSLRWLDLGRPFRVPRDVWDRAKPVKTWKMSTGESPVHGQVRILADQDADWCLAPVRPCRLVWG